MIPWVYFVIFAETVGVKVHIHSAVCKGLYPQLPVKAFIPAVKYSAVFIGMSYNFGQAPVSSGKYCFQETGVSIGIADFYLFVGFAAFQKIVLLFLYKL